MSRRALIVFFSLAMSLQWLVLPAFADDVSQGAATGQSADPIVQAQWSALVDAASNAQNRTNGSTGAPANLNGGASYNSSLLVPQPATRGVDIINESMKYHNSSSMQPFNSQMNGGMLGNYSQMQNGQNSFNSYGMQVGMSSMNSMNNGINGGMNSINGGMNAMGGINSMNGMMNKGMSNNFVMPAGGNPMQGQMMQSQMMGNGCMHQGHCCHGNGMNNAMNGMMNNGMMNNGSSDGLNTQAIGALGAATLMGVFMQKGGVGGILQDMGWDNNRHTRGSSIGGY